LAESAFKPDFIFEDIAEMTAVFRRIMA